MLFEQNWNSVPGGTARSVNRLAEALVGHGGVDLVGVHGGHRRTPSLPLPDGLAGIRPIATPGRLLNQAWSLGVGPRIESIVRPDLVHAPAYLWPRTDAPVVSHLHDLAFVRHPEWFSANGVGYLTRFLDQVRASNGPCIVPTAITAADCEAAGIAAERLHVIAWGADPVSVEPDRIEAMLNRLQLDEPPVLFVGTLEPRKNLETLARAMQRLPHRTLVVVGPSGWGNVTPPADALVLGEVSDDDLSTLYACAGVLAYPSLFEGFGLPVLEAMAHRTAVVVAEHTAPAEIAGAAGIAVDPRDPIQLADAIESVLEDASLRNRLRRAARARVSGFGWDRTAASTIAVYESVAE